MRNLIGIFLLWVSGILIGLGLAPHMGSQSSVIEDKPPAAEKVQEVQGTKEIELAQEPVNKKAVLRIPELGREWVYPIVPGVSDAVLDAGVIGKFPEATTPGGEGNYSLIAHRITHGEPFRYLTDVDKGDLVLVDSGDTRYTYEVDKIFVVDYTDVEVLDSVGDKRLITLITCNSLAPTDERLVVQGELKNVRSIE